MIRYTFLFDQDPPVEFEYHEDRDISPDLPPGPVPGWMRLDRHRCDDCTLPPGSRNTCPAAVAIRPILESFNPRTSHETVRVRALVRDVTFEWTTPTQRAVRSLMELALPLSSCPVMMMTRPLAYQHVPFAVRGYTAFRFLGMHFIAQYLRKRDGLEPDWDLDELLKLVRAMRRVYATLAHRVRAAAEKDATINSLLLLDAFTDAIEMGIEGGLESLRPLFRVYLEGQPGNAELGLYKPEG